jgi:hypothetical protein
MSWALNAEWLAARLFSASLMTVVATAITAGNASGQTPVPEQPSPRPSIVIPLPKPFELKDPLVRRNDLSAQRKPDGQREQKVSPTVPDIPALQDTPNGSDPGSRPNDTGATPAPPPHLPVDTALIPGRVVEPIDLANALRLAGARDLDIAVARQQIFAATADLMAARALWLPSLFYGPSWYRSDGQIQTVTGQVQTINRSALFLGGTAALANTIQGPPPGTGIPSVNGLTTTVRISDAIFIPMAARRVLTANEAGLRAATNDALLQIAQAYFDLQGATGRPQTPTPARRSPAPTPSSEWGWRPTIAVL